MCASTITLSILGPLVAFFLGATVTALTLLGSPFTINSPQGCLVTALGAAPGVALSLIAVVAALRSASRRQRVASAPSSRSGRW